ncbi:MAG TPA: hypothetical protein VF614_03770 [Chthoniobacteraceae bacterium]
MNLSRNSPAENFTSRALSLTIRPALSQIAKQRQEGTIDQEGFESQVEQVKREELNPMGLSLLVRELADGRTRFLVKADGTGAVYDLIDCGGN